MTAVKAKHIRRGLMLFLCLGLLCGFGYVIQKISRPQLNSVSEETKRFLAKEGGIQWFGRLDQALQEAQRLNRPMLFVSAAPHCAGVSGIW